MQPYIHTTKDFYNDLIVPAHRGQKYGNRPYTTHLREVFNVWSSMFEPQSDCSAGQAVFDKEIQWVDSAEFACLGHDYLEDCKDASLMALREHGCPEEAIYAIVLVTKPTEDYNYKQYLRGIVGNQLAFEVKVADSYANMTCSIKDGDFKRVQRYSKQINLLYKYREQFLGKLDKGE
tara:strand:- start:860 stop:1390 length:531 start_codon:yes stop_codon:yes gene_type:complete